MQGNLKDIPFREFVAKRHYPFTDGSRMVSSDGRRIPLSVVYDAILYPEAHGTKPVYVSRIYSDTSTLVELTDGESTWRGAISSDANGCRLYGETGRRVGTIVFSDAGVVYLTGMTRLKALTFTPQGLVIRPDRIIPRPVSVVSVVVEGTPVSNTSLPLTTVLGSDRLSLTTSGEAIGTIALDNMIGSDTPKRIIQRVNGVVVNDRPVYIRTDPSLNLQIVEENGSIVFHKRGDA